MVSEHRASLFDPAFLTQNVFETYNHPEFSKMHLKVLAVGLFLGTVSARPAFHRRGVDCSFSTTADSGATCESFASSWGMLVDDLTSLNPGIQPAWISASRTA